MKTKLPPFNVEKMLALSIGKTEHSPGPWRFATTPSFGDGPFRLLAGNSVIATVILQQDNATDEANAALIASAPDLLADNQRLREQVAQLSGILQVAVSCTSPSTAWVPEAKRALSAVERGAR